MALAAAAANRNLVQGVWQAVSGLQWTSWQRVVDRQWPDSGQTVGNVNVWKASAASGQVVGVGGQAGTQAGRSGQEKLVGSRKELATPPAAAKKGSYDVMPAAGGETAQIKKSTFPLAFPGSSISQTPGPETLKRTT